MPLPVPLAFVFNQLRRLVITPFDPQPGFDGFLERAQTESNDRAQVTVAVLSGREAQRLFGVPVNRRGIQPVFVRVENRSADGLRLQVECFALHELGLHASEPPASHGYSAAHRVLTQAAEPRQTESKKGTLR